MGCCRSRSADDDEINGSHGVAQTKHAQMPPIAPPEQEIFVDSQTMQDVGPVGILGKGTNGTGNGTNGTGSSNGHGASHGPLLPIASLHRTQPPAIQVGAAADDDGEVPWQAQPSGESFHTCFSQETQLRRLVMMQVTAQTSVSSRPRPAYAAQSPPELQAHGIQHPQRASPQQGVDRGTPVSVGSANTLSTISSSLSGRYSDETELKKVHTVPANGELGNEGAADALIRVSSSPAFLDGQGLAAESWTQAASASSSNLGDDSRTSTNYSNRRSVASAIRRSLTVGSQQNRSSKRHSKMDGEPKPPRMSRRPSLIKRKYQASQNPNMPHEYAWMVELLEMICCNKTSGVGSLDRASPHAQTTSPLFAVCGACPSSWESSMQAILYSAVGNGAANVEFWWIKPMKGQPSAFERQTLDCWAKGPHKNQAGRMSKNIYQPIADLFVLKGNQKVKQDFCFGMESTCGTHRAFIEDPRASPPSRYYLYLVWQEEWTKSMMSRDQFIKGKIAYQREPQRELAAVVYMREYSITNGKFDLADVEEPCPPGSVIPQGAALKELGALKAKS